MAEELLEAIDQFVFWDAETFNKGIAETTVLELIRECKKEWCRQQREKDKIIIEKAVEIIKEWHNADAVWDIYFNHAPEMKIIREFLNAPEP
jgi:hypothetical protein